MKLGVIGGMGSEATSYYFSELVTHTKVWNDQDHIDTVIINHASLPDRTESISGNKSSELLNLLIKDAQLLESIGVDNIAIPCNTAHYYYDSIQEKISVPIINMIKETIEYIMKEFNHVKKVGIMSTTGTLKSGVYKSEFNKLEIDVIDLSSERQEEVMSLIYDDIKSGKLGDIEKFQRAYDEFSNANADVVILACTELSVYKKNNKVPRNCIDPLDILVRESVVRSNAKYQ